MSFRSRLKIAAMLAGLTACPIANTCHAQVQGEHQPQVQGPTVLPDLAPLYERLERIDRSIEGLRPRIDPSEQRRAERDLKAQEEMARWARWMTVIAVVSGAISAFGVGFILLTLRQNRSAIRIAMESVRIAERQLIADSRPWVTVDAELVGPVCFVKDGNGHVQGSLIVNFTLRNIGKTPALNVLTYARAIASPFDAPTKLRDQFGDVLGQRAASPVEVGQTIFPSDTHFEPHELILSPGELGRAMRNFVYPGIEGAVAPSILVCVAYDMPSTGKTHETGLVFQLRHVGPTSFGPVKVELGEIPSQEFAFNRAIIGGYVT